MLSTAIKQSPTIPKIISKLLIVGGSNLKIIFPILVNGIIKAKPSEQRRRLLRRSDGCFALRKNSFVLIEKKNAISVNMLNINQFVCSTAAGFLKKNAKNEKSKMLVVIPKIKTIAINLEIRKL